MVGFRNIAIYDYQALDVKILKAILTKHLKDLEQFYTFILTHFDIAKKTRKKRNRASYFWVSVGEVERDKNTMEAISYCPISGRERYLWMVLETSI